MIMIILKVLLNTENENTESMVLNEEFLSFNIF